MSPSDVGRAQIEATENVIRRYIRRTPIVEVDGRDFGLESVTLVLKLEFLQQSGSFKARGAFAKTAAAEHPRRRGCRRVASRIEARLRELNPASGGAERGLRPLVDVFGEAGRHARFAVGVASLPAGAAVEVAATFALSEVSARRADVFFHGLFMDVELLRQKGLEPKGVELATVDGFALRIGERAALVPVAGARVHGVVMSLTPSELDQLYSVPSVQAYKP